MWSTNRDRNDDGGGDGNEKRVFIEIGFCSDNRSNLMPLTIKTSDLFLPPLASRKKRENEKTAKVRSNIERGHHLARKRNLTKDNLIRFLNYFPLMTSNWKSNGNRSSRPRFIDSHQRTARHLSYSLSILFQFFFFASPSSSVFPILCTLF